MAQQATINETRQEIAAKASADDKFRARLLMNPKSLIEQEYGISLPSGVEVKVVEDTPYLFHIVLPSATEYELGDDDLDAVVGGAIGVLGATVDKI